MPSAARIEIPLKGIDNASKVIDGVKAKLEGLNQSVTDGGNVAKQATSVASAGFSAMNGTLTGAISGARGMAQAISGMGVAMSTALPIAGAIAAALFGLKKAYDYIQKAQEARADAIRKETDAMLEQSKAARGLASQYDAMVRQRNRMAQVRADLEDADPLRRKEIEGEGLTIDLGLRKKAASAVAGEIGKLEAELAGYQALLDSNATASKSRKAAEESIERVRKEIEDNRKSLSGLNDDIQYLQAAIKLNAKQQTDLAQKIKAEKEQEEAEKRYEAAKKAGEEFLKLAELEENVIEQLQAMASRRDEEIKRNALASLQRSVSQVTSGARSTSLEEVNKINALMRNGLLQASANGYTTSQGDAMREAEARAKTQQYQTEMLSLVRKMEQKAGYQQGTLQVNVMDF